MLADTLSNRNIFIVAGIILLIGVGLTCLVGSAFDKAILEADKGYDKALKITEENAEEFPYAVKTQQGGINATGPIIAISPRLTDDRLNGDFLAIEEIFEEYRMHTETYSCNCRTVNGKTSCSTCTRQYWSWDYSGSNKRKVETISLLGQEMSGDFIPWAYGLKDINLANGHTYYYYGSSKRSRFAVLSEKLGSWGFVSNQDGFVYDSSLDGPQKGSLAVIKWVVMIILLFGTGVLIYYFINLNYEVVDRYI